MKEFRNILLDQKLRIYTDHKDPTCKNFNTNKVLVCRLMLEEYRPDIYCAKEEKNIVADKLSRLPLHGNQENAHKSTYQN